MRFRVSVPIALSFALLIAACVHKAPAVHPPVQQVAIAGITASGYIGKAQHLTQTLEQSGVLPTREALTVQQTLRDASATAVDQLVPLLREIDSITDDVTKAQKLDKARVLARDLIASAAKVFTSLKGNSAAAGLAGLIDQIIASASGLVGSLTAQLGV